jgi:hypothetical protein
MYAGKYPAREKMNQKHKGNNFKSGLVRNMSEGLKHGTVLLTNTEPHHFCVRVSTQLYVFKLKLKLKQASLFYLPMQNCIKNLVYHIHP